MGDSDKTSSISLFSQNMWGVPIGAPNRKERFSRFESVTEAVPSDVYLLQETFTKKHRDTFITGPWRKKHPYFHDENQTNWQNGKFIGSGLVALSKLEIISHHFLPYKNASITDGWANKGVMLVTVKLPNGQEIDIYNTHMQAEYQVGVKQATEIRRKQLVQLRDFICQKSGVDRNVIVVGDLNIQEKSQLYYLLVDPDGDIAKNEMKFIDVLRQLYPDDKRHHLISFRNRNPKREKRIDYILLRPANGWMWDKDQSTGEILDMLLADHNALWAKLTLAPKPPPAPLKAL